MLEIAAGLLGVNLNELKKNLVCRRLQIPGQAEWWVPLCVCYFSAYLLVTVTAMSIFRLIKLLITAMHWPRRFRVYSIASLSFLITVAGV